MLIPLPRVGPVDGPIELLTVNDAVLPFASRTINDTPVEEHTRPVVMIVTAAPDVKTVVGAIVAKSGEVLSMVYGGCPPKI